MREHAVKNRADRRVWLALLLALTGIGTAPAEEPSTTTPVCVAPAAATADPALDATARALAGLDAPASEDAKVAAAWSTHREQLERPFARLNTRQFTFIRDWREQTLEPTLGQPSRLFYAFSGPDVLYATALFPHAQRMLFTGLEPVGELPDPAALQPAELTSSLTELRRSLSELLGKSFFVTSRMQSQFHRNRFEGVTPIMLLLLARSGYTLESVQAVALGTQGMLCARSFDDKEIAIPGVLVRYRGANDSAPRELVYLRADLSNDGMAKTPEYATYVRETLKPDVAYLKSASYLMHGGAFSAIRELIQETPAILEDDSGIPYRHFPATSWTADFYGHYVRGGGGFERAVQPDLVKAFANAEKRPLPFWIGYRHGPADSNLQLYRRRPAQ